jgi:hypothetical protein
MAGIKANVSFDRSKKLASKFTRAEVSSIIREGMEHAASLGRGKAHKQTGELESSIHADFSSAYRGALVSDVPQAVFEMDKGGDHDWATDAFNAGVELIHTRIHEALSG